MRLPVNEKNLIDMRSFIGSIFTVEEKIELGMPVSIYRACFTNVKAI